MSGALAPSSRFPRTIGILGGLGPFAHVAFEARLLAQAARSYGARQDADHPGWILCSFPATPDRTAALEARGPDPRPHLLDGLARLARAGADFAVIPCNTAHTLLGPCEDLPLPVLDVVGETTRALLALPRRPHRLGLLATTGTCRSGLFQQRLIRQGFEVVTPSPPGQQAVMQSIYGNGRIPGLKGGDRRSARRLLASAARDLVMERGVDALLVACSELSMVASARLSSVRCHDTMDMLAAAALEVASLRRTG